MVADAPRDPAGTAWPRRVLVVCWWLGPEVETDVRQLAAHLDPARHALDVVVCMRREGAPAAWPLTGVRVDTIPYTLSFEDTIAYLCSVIPAYDVVVPCQDPPDLYAALELLAHRPPLVAPSSAESGSRWAAVVAALAVEQPRAPAPGVFASFVQGGFECSSHRRHVDRQRVDVIAATQHDARAAEDYRLLARHGILTVRDGARWHLIEGSGNGRRDFGSLDRQLDAAAQTGTQVIWDLVHYGWPDDVDVWGPGFVPRLVEYAVATASRIANRTPGPHWFAPVNEISFFSWGGGEVAYLNPFVRRRGTELKVQLVRAAIGAARAVREVVPDARFVQPEPLVHVAATSRDDAEAAFWQRQAQFEAWDMLSGRAWPQLGGSSDLLDVVGVNYYHDNQWLHGGPHLQPGDPRRRPFADLLAEVYGRYGRPVLVSETGIEGDVRAAWFTDIWEQVALARSRGVPVEGICLYPVLGHPGWDDERYCPNGLLELLPTGDRQVHEPLADAVGRLTSASSRGR